MRTQRVRDRMKRNLLTTLMLSQGVPMLLGGDEIGRTQSGNNNAYCQDNETSWLNWEVGATGRDFTNFVRYLIQTMQSNPILRRRNFFTGEAIHGGPTKDVTWIRPDGHEMTDAEWSESENRSIGMLLLGRAADEVDALGRSERGDTLLVLLNAGHSSRSYTLPTIDSPGHWDELLSTLRPIGSFPRPVRGTVVNLGAQSSLLLRHTARPDP